MTSFRPRSLALLALVPILFGCAARSPFNQDYVEVRTPHFEITSSFGEEETRALARDLEVFHSATLYTLGLPPDTPSPVPTRVFAFDGRGVTRPFATRGDAASLIPSVDGPLWLIRAPGSFAERIGPDLRHRYAHRVLRDHSKRRPPLWYEEGRAQVASTIRLAETTARVGVASTAHRRRVLDWRRSDLTPVLSVRDLSEANATEREAFESDAWALVYTVLFDTPRQSAGRTALDPVRRAFESDRPGALASAIADLGEPEALTARIYHHLGATRQRTDRLQLAEAAASIESTPIAIEEARDRLAQLALDLGRPGLALDYFDRALAARPDWTRAEAGRILALAGLGRTEEARTALERFGGDDAGEHETALRRARAQLVLAERAGDAGERSRDRQAARHAFERVLERRPEDPVAWVGLARCELGAGGDPEKARASLERARRLRPGALAIDVWMAQSELDAGRARAARFRLAQILSRTHDLRLRRRAKAMLESIEREGTR